MPNLRAPLAVVIDRTGAVLPTVRQDAPIRLDLAELNWLAVLAGSDPIEGAPTPLHTLAPLVAELAWHEQSGSVAQLPAAPKSEALNPSIDPASPYIIVNPVAFRLSSGGFELVDHLGLVSCRLNAREFAAALSFVSPRVTVDAFGEQATRLGPSAFVLGDFEALTARLIAAGIVIRLDDDRANLAEGREIREFRDFMIQLRRRQTAADEALAAGALAEEQLAATTGQRRTRVVPVNSEGYPLPSLGLLMAYAMDFEGGRLNDHYDFVRDWLDRTVPALTGDEPPGIYLFSNYIWSHADNVLRSAEVKGKIPNSLTVHGGPNTPKYDDDVATYFASNPHVDITVHGEGEVTFADLLDALVGCLGDGPPDLSGLRDVPGLIYRDGDEIVRTGKRDRVADLDTIPSPYNTGLFDSIGESEIPLMTVETNRGCPYGCTFCDWGSATMSRMRKFDLQRVYDELEWCAKNKVKVIFCADSNFGIFARDVDIARKIVELNQTYGYPKRFESSYAKNTVKHLREIIETMAEGGVLSTGTLSLQSLDQSTLDTIHRSNIKVEKYDDLALEFEKHDLPLVIELMMGLPGATMDSFLGDLQQCIDREVHARVHPTEVLMNSPMNESGYRSENEIEILRPLSQDWTEDRRTRKKALIISTATFTRADYEEMGRYRRLFLLSENYGVLRQISRFVRQETGTREIDFYGRIDADARTSPDRWPAMAFTFGAMTDFMIPPVSWQLFIDEVREYCIRELGIADSTPLDTVLRVQHALLPSRDRRYPCIVDLEHDFAGWHQAMIEAKRGGEQSDWWGRVSHLASFGPAKFEVTDPQSLGDMGLGMSLSYDTDADWEMQSPVARAMQFRHRVHS